MQATQIGISLNGVMAGLRRMLQQRARPYRTDDPGLQRRRQLLQRVLEAQRTYLACRQNDFEVRERGQDALKQRRVLE